MVRATKFGYIITYGCLNNNYITEVLDWRKLVPEYGMQLHNFLHGAGNHLSMTALPNLDHVD